MLLLVLDLVGIAVFAASGALAGVRARLDVFGVCVLGATTAIGGGVLRDVLLGATPPNALRDWRYLAVPLLVGIAVFWFHPAVAGQRRAILLADAAGMGLFAATGTATALAADASVLASCLIGMTTAIGGGVLRDLLLREIPVVLRREIYALAALGGAVVVAAGQRLELPSAPVLVTAVALAGGVRVLALRRRWNAPAAGGGATGTTAA
ncbi:MAG TPA: trimeric intracellular cation channel family protein [Pseudonocardiaceae bacterium]